MYVKNICFLQFVYIDSEEELKQTTTNTTHGATETKTETES